MNSAMSTSGSALRVGDGGHEVAVGLGGDGGASGVRLTRPDGVPVRLQVRGGASKLAFDAQAFGAIGGGVRLQSPGFEDAAGRYDVIVGGGASRLTVASA